MVAWMNSPGHRKNILTSVTENGDVNTVAGTYYKSVTVSLQGDGFTPGQSTKVYMTLVPGTYNGNIYISTDKNLYRYSGKTIVADRAVVKTIKADLSSGSADNSKEIKSALDYEVFAMAANAGDYSAWVDGAGEVKLGAERGFACAAGKSRCVSGILQ